MRLKLIWKATQDELLFDVINNDLVSWFVEQSATHGNNRYEAGDQVIDSIMHNGDTQTLIEQEVGYVTTVNNVLTKLKLPTFSLPTDWFEQKQLNNLHKDWAQTRYQIPKLTELLYKIDNKYFEAYQEMNCHIHLIEKSFQYRFRDKIHWRIENPFKDVSYEWEVCHLFLEYPGHGRNAYEKFQWLDDDIDMSRDLNNWDNIDSFLGMQLSRPYKIDPPKEFLDWCKKYNLTPHGYTIPLANLTDWPNELTRARNIMTKNVKINDNYFSLELIE